MNGCMPDAELLQVVGGRLGQDGEHDAVGPQQQAGQGVPQEGVQPHLDQPSGGPPAQRAAEVEVEVDQRRPPADTV